MDYNEPQENLFEGESIFAAANKVLDYEAFKREQEKLLKNSSKKDKNSTLITANKISQKYKNLKKLKKKIFTRRRRSRNNCLRSKRTRRFVCRREYPYSCK